MSEEQTQTAKPEQPADDAGKGDIAATTSVIDRADSIAKRLEEANKRAEEILGKQEAIAARLVLGGRAEAGQPTKTTAEIEKELVDKQIDELMRRTGMKK